MPENRDQKTRSNRRRAGYASVMAVIPPDLVVQMDRQRGDMPRSEWLIRSAFGVPPERPLGRRNGRPPKIDP